MHSALPVADSGAGADQEQRQCASGAPSAGSGSPSGVRGLSQVEDLYSETKVVE